jgi:hypothetical protein
MWPSEATATTTYNIANIALIGSLVVGVVATVLVVWMGNVKESYLNQSLAQANLETERLKAEVSWRDVTPAQVAIIKSVMRRRPMEITVSWIAGDAEGSNFARRLAETFVTSGSAVSAFAPMAFLGSEPPAGIALSGSEKSEVELLADALHSAHLGNVSVSIDNPKPDGSKYYTHVLVGYRPVPMIQ